jgi:hypothetical protein
LWRCMAWMNTIASADQRAINNGYKSNF